MISIDIKDVLKCLRLFWSKYISPEPSNLGEPNPPDNLLLTGVLSRMSIIRIQSDLKLGCERLEVLLYRLYKNRYDPAFDARKTDDEIKTLFYLMRYDLGRLQSIGTSAG